MENIDVIKSIRTAIKKGDIEYIKNIIGLNKDILNVTTPFGSWLHVASSHGKLDIVQYLLNQGLDINIIGGTFNGTAINEASSCGHFDIVKYLLTNGAILDISEPERNPLFAAIYGGHKDIVKLLLDFGIDASVRYTGEYMKNMDAYDFAIERGQKEIAAMLLPHKI